MAATSPLTEVINMAERSGRLNLSTEDICARLPGMSPAALRQALHRQQRKGRIVKLSRGSNHWLIVPLQHADIGAPPLEVWLDRYMSKTLGTSYYVSLLSAAEIYGASPFGVMVTQVMVPERRRPITIGRHQLVFHTRKHINNMPVAWHETADGRFRVSTPELTALELIERAPLLGGIPRVREVLRDLLPSCTSNGLAEALDALQAIPTAQRLGSVLHLDKHPLSALVAEWLRGKKFRLVPLQNEPTKSQALDIDTEFKVQLSVVDGGANT
jgi:predicted transcriptional regulator of viral defense system